MNPAYRIFKEGKFEEFKAFLEKENEPEILWTKQKYSLFYCLILSSTKVDFFEKLTFILERFNPIHKKIEFGAYPLQIAVQLSAPKELISFLIEKGADMNTMSDEGETTFSLCLKARLFSVSEEKELDFDTTILELLLRNGANMIPPSYSHNLSSFMNSLHKKTEILRFLKSYEPLFTEEQRKSWEEIRLLSLV